MRYAKVNLLVVCLVLIYGCENKELITCQEENLQLAEQVEMLEDQVTEQKEQAGKQAGLLMDVRAEGERKIAALTQENNDLRQSQRQSREKLKMVEAELARMRAQNKELLSQNEQLNQALVEAKANVKKTGEMLLELSKENKKLEKQIAELEGGIEIE